MLSKSNIRAVRKVIFEVTRELVGLNSTPEPITGSQVNMKAALVWLIRDMRLNGFCGDSIKINLKLDGRPFWG